MTYLLLPCISMFSVFIVVHANLSWKIKSFFLNAGFVFFKQRIPIISCEYCTCFWLSLFYSLGHFEIFESIIFAGASAFLTAPLKKLL